MPAKVPVVERRSRIVCHFPMNRVPSVVTPNQMRVVHEFIRFLKKSTLMGFTTSALYENVYTGYWRPELDSEFQEENVVLITIDHPLDKSDAMLWDFVVNVKREVQRLYKRFADQREQDVWIVVHSIDRLVLPIFFIPQPLSRKMRTYHKRRSLMKRIGLGLLATFVLLCVARAGDETALKKELAELQGKWKVVKIQTNEKAPDNLDITIEFLKDGKAVEIKNGTIAKKGVVEINPATRPKTITIFPEERDRVILGIYKIEKGILTICMAESFRHGRPTEFAVIKDKPFGVLTAERAK